MIAKEHHECYLLKIMKLNDASRYEEPIFV